MNILSMSVRTWHCRFLKGSLTLFSVDAHEVIRITNNQSNKHSSAFHNIPLDILKLSICNIAVPLACIINSSLCTSIFPHREKDLFGNYWPISVLPSFKILERQFRTDSWEYLQLKKILSHSQHGFRRNHSTYMAIIEMYHKISAV